MPNIRTVNTRRRNAEFRRAHPVTPLDTGFGPRDAEVGETVKIGFSVWDGYNEWMWAEVIRKEGEVYTVKILNSSFYGGPIEGQHKRITASNILTTWDNCPMRAMQDLEPLGGSGAERLDRLREFEQETGLPRREAICKLLEGLAPAA